MDSGRINLAFDPLDEVKVKALAESIQAVGLQNPIHVWKASDNEVILVAGHHRLAAAKQLNDLKRAWQKANDDARQMFTDWLVKASS